MNDGIIEYKNNRKLHKLVTPEGVELPFTIANKGERLGALVLDQIFIYILMLITFFAISSLFTLSYSLRNVLLYLLFFLLRNFYFITFEIFMDGRTPGKKILKLRVINIEGGTLNLSALIIRNITREVEVMFPIALLFAPGEFAELGILGAAKYIGIIWIGIAGIIIFINKQHRRAGDLLAGTLVVNAPEKISINQIDTVVESGKENSLSHSFTQEQLQHYGEYELQKLEYILRNNEINSDSFKLREIADSIRKKINWSESYESDSLFLQDFYKAQRQYLENHMLFGKRRASKYEKMRG